MAGVALPGRSSWIASGCCGRYTATAASTGGASIGILVASGGALPLTQGLIQNQSGGEKVETSSNNKCKNHVQGDRTETGLNTMSTRTQAENSSVTFSLGLRSNHAPMKEGPAGALITVVEDPGTRQVVGTQVVRNSSWIYGNPGVLRFMVNDCSGTRSTNAGSLTLKLTRLKPKSVVAHEMVNAIESTIKTVKKKEMARVFSYGSAFCDRTK